MAATAKARRKSTTRRKPASARSKMSTPSKRSVAAKRTPASRTVSFAKVVQEANRLQRVAQTLKNQVKAALNFKKNTIVQRPLNQSLSSGFPSWSNNWKSGRSRV